MAARSASRVYVAVSPPLFHLREKQQGHVKGPTVHQREFVRIPVPFAVDQALHRGVKHDVRLESLLRELVR